MSKALVGIGCTRGSEHSCQAAISSHCDCACIGANHSILLSHPFAQITTPKKELITECSYCGRECGYNVCSNEWQHYQNPWADVSHKPQVKRIDGTI